jgi:hypothetical protein
MTYRLVGVAVACFVCAFTAAAEQVWPASPPYEFVRQWRHIEGGLTRQQVHALLGRPTDTNITQRRDFWLFPASRPQEFCIVTYDSDGRVSGFGGSRLFTGR